MNPLIEQFKDEKRWVNFSIVTVGGRLTKVPYSPITKGKASSVKESDWGTYEQAVAVNKDNIGIVFTSEKKLLGIDLDGCLDGNNIIGDDKELIAQLIIEADSYCEISPSGKGLHILLSLTEPLTLIANRHNKFEAYTEGRYFTVTQNVYKEEKEVRTVTPEEAIKLLEILSYPWKKKEITTRTVRNSVALDDETIIKKMFASKNGATLKVLYDGDISNYKNDPSSADLALCNTLAFWSGKDAVQMERIWLASPLGSREKTQTRADYRVRTIDTAINNCQQVYSPDKKMQVAINDDEYEDIDFDFLFTLKGKEMVKFVTLCTENITRALRLHPFFKGKLRFDTFKGCIEVSDNLLSETSHWRQFEENDILIIQRKISTTFTEFQTVKKDMVYDAICSVSYENRIDSAIDFLSALVWDKQERLNTWLINTYGVPDDEYHRTVGSNWLKGLVKRLVIPGCKFDYVLVLEGEQGTKKSSSLGVLGGDWHVETTMGMDTKDFFMQFAAKAIIEFSEGETLSRTEVKRMKAVITTQSDRYRAPYERVSKDHPRRCVFAMTTNSTEYLKDETGNRRWWPVATVLPKANLEWLAENREQIFAEAYHKVIVNKESTWEVPEEATREAQDARRISDPNTELVCNWYFEALKETDRRAGITVLQAHIEAFGNQFSKKMNKFEEMSISNIYKDVLKLDKKRKMINGIQAIRWFPKDMTDEEIAEEVVFNFSSDRIQKAFESF